MVNKADSLDIDRFVDENVDIEGYTPPFPANRKRKIIRTRRSRDISNYDCWVSFNRDLLVAEYHRTPVSKISVPPAVLRHIFGDPFWAPASTTTGIYTFEDTNLDVFVIAEPNWTTGTREPNKDPEYYEIQKNSFQKGRREEPRLSRDEFWDSEEDQEFFIFTSNYAEYRKFKTWLRKQILELKDEKSLEEKVNEKYGDMFSQFDDYDTDYSKYNERGAESMGIFNYRWSDYLDDKERKEYKDEIPPLPKPAEFLPFDKATKMNLNQEQLEEIYQELKEAEKEKN